MLLAAWFKAFLLTLAIECPIAAWILKVPAADRKRLPVLLVFANLATHPAVWFVFPDLPLPARATFVLSELFAFGAEALFYAVVFKGISLKRAVLAALVANATSLGIGLLLYRFFPRFLLG